MTWRIFLHRMKQISKVPFCLSETIVLLVTLDVLLFGKIAASLHLQRDVVSTYFIMKICFELNKKLSHI